MGRHPGGTRSFPPPNALQVVYGNIPGGGMSRSASLTINLVLDVFDVNAIVVGEDFAERMKVVDLSQVGGRGLGELVQPVATW